MSHDDFEFLQRAIDKARKLCEEYYKMSGCHVPDLPSIQNITDIFDRVSKIENSYVSANMIHEMRQTIETWQRGCEVQMLNLQKCNRELEKAYQADAQVAKDIIFEGARRNEEIREIKSECEIHCGAITCLESKVKELEKRLEALEKNKYVQQVQYFGGKKPHKCPICDGAGKKLFLISQQVQKCESCHETGIVWG